MAVVVTGGGVIVFVVFAVADGTVNVAVGPTEEVITKVEVLVDVTTGVVVMLKVTVGVTVVVTWGPTSRDISKRHQGYANLASCRAESLPLSHANGFPSSLFPSTNIIQSPDTI